MGQNSKHVLIFLLLVMFLGQQSHFDCDQYQCAEPGSQRAVKSPSHRAIKRPCFRPCTEIKPCNCTHSVRLEQRLCVCACVCVYVWVWDLLLHTDRSGLTGTCDIYMQTFQHLNFLSHFMYFGVCVFFVFFYLALFHNTLQTKDHLIGHGLSSWGQRYVHNWEKADFWVSG